jgi:hypothetical protein
MNDRLRFNVKRPRIIVKLPPSLQSLVRRNGHTIHRDAVSQRTQDRESREEAGFYGSIELFFPPALSHLVRDVALNEQREENVSVGDTRH